MSIFRNHSFVWIGLLTLMSVACKGRTGRVDTMGNEVTGKQEQLMPENRLSMEQSPYLQQHKDNPVDWQPWGAEAFELAKKEDKPVFLSIGYATCHWCHVMAHESFEDEQVAKLMNETFISIKVDREERPDIDNIYMSVCHLMTGSGGWPLTIIMTPDKKPFFAATYIPKETRFGRNGMMSLVPKIKNAWSKDREELLRSSDKVVAALERSNSDKPGRAPDVRTFDAAYSQLRSSFDESRGGFGTSPKFPTPHQLLFLLRYWQRSNQPEAIKMVTKTLTEMRKGGIYDHVGFGFHRYSTDRDWLVPHFEKMLYDQALLLMTYVEAYQATGDPLFERTAREIATYVLRDMTSNEGGFYCAEDADSEGEEGKFYVWTEGEVRDVLSSTSGDLFVDVFGITHKGNFDDESTGQQSGNNILHLKETFDQLAQRSGWSSKQLNDRIEESRLALFNKREARVHPLKDDKILTDWNGLMIGALAQAGRVLAEPRYTKAAQKAAEFVLESLTTSDGRLLHRYRNGQAGLDAHLEDYSFFVFALLELYQATFDPELLEEAKRLNDLMMKHFWDEDSGGLFFTADDAERLLVRSKELYDGAIPSGNSVAFGNLVKLSRITGDVQLEGAGAELLEAFGLVVSRRPSAYTMLLVGLDFAIGPSVEVVIAGDPDAIETKEMLGSLTKIYAPNKVVLLRTEESVDGLVTVAPFVEYQPMLKGKATAYVCVAGACEFPTNDVKKMIENVQRKLLVKSKP